MKAITGLLILLAISVSAQNNVKISGSFSPAITDTTLTFENFLNPGAFSQSVAVKGNKFSVEFKCEREDIYKLRLSQQNYVALVVKPGDKITITLNPSALGNNPSIQGSEQSIRLYATETALTNLKLSQDSLNTVFGTINPADEARKKELENEYYVFENQKNTVLYNAVAGHPGDMVNLFFMDRLNIDIYYPLFVTVDSLLNLNYSYNQAVAGLHSKVISNKSTAVGSKAPEIKLPTPEGDSLSLYSIQGKVIIIDFWASWCRPCRAENPNMVSLYADYHNKGLEIFGVSLDKDKAAWVKAIADDKLVWNHVSDLKFWQSEAARLYGVGSIPSMFVLDGNFTIIAKNLRGDQLRAFVASKLD